MKLIISICIVVFSFSIQAEQDRSQICIIHDEFKVYIEGIKAEKTGDLVLAFEIYCDLAVRGDYRAQYKLASMYQNGIKGRLKPDLRTAYFWAHISNSHAYSRKKQILMEELAKQLEADVLDDAKNLADKAIDVLPRGRRLDQVTEPITAEELKKKLKELQSRTNIHVGRPIGRSVRGY